MFVRGKFRTALSVALLTLLVTMGVVETSSADSTKNLTTAYIINRIIHPQWIGNSPFCGGEESDCAPAKGQYYITDGHSGDGLQCVTGKKVLCANLLRRNFNLKWLGTAPFCDVKPEDCVNDGGVFLGVDSDGDGRRCASGQKQNTKVLCGYPVDADVQCQIRTMVGILGAIPESELRAIPDEKLYRTLHYKGRKITRDNIKICGSDFPIRVDVGGEGYVVRGDESFGFKNTINLNTYNRITSTGPGEGEKFANFLAGDASDMPFAQGFVDELYMQNGPATPAVLDEFARVISPNGFIFLTGADMGWVNTLAKRVEGTVTEIVYYKGAVYKSYAILVGALRNR